ncbi:MAG: hypothetical protein IPI29_08510 [Ignavibacteria bacterium]|nr:hypothetical protein [Ignavibacteria bacterium]
MRGWNENAERLDRRAVGEPDGHGYQIEYDESELDALIEAYGIEPDGDGSEIFTEVASRLREIDVLKKRNRELEDAIVSINEYWNGSNSQESMSHALDYIVGLTGELMQGGAT